MVQCVTFSWTDFTENFKFQGFFFYYNFPPKRYFGSTDNIWSLIWCCTEFTFDLMKTLLGVLSNQNQPLTLSHSWWDTDCRESSNVVSLPEPDNWVDGFNCSKRNWAGTERLFPKLCLNEAWDFKLVWLKTHLKKWEILWLKSYFFFIWLILLPDLSDEMSFSNMDLTGFLNWSSVSCSKRDGEQNRVQRDTDWLWFFTWCVVISVGAQTSRGQQRRRAHSKKTRKRSDHGAVTSRPRSDLTRQSAELNGLDFSLINTDKQKWISNVWRTYD